MNRTKAKMNANDMVSQCISSSIHFRKVDNNKTDLKIKIKTKALEIWGLKMIMNEKEKKGKNQEKYILKRIIKVQRLEIENSLEILKSQDPKMAEKLLKTLNLENLQKENFKEQKLKTKKFLHCRVEPEHERIGPSNTQGELNDVHSEKVVFLV